MTDSFRRRTRILTFVLLAVIALAVLRRLAVGSRRATEGAPPADHPIRLPATNTGADIEVETVAGEHVVGGVETTDAMASDESAPAAAPSTPWWVMPEGDSCPASHPVKVKQSSGIYHVPGGFNYDRTKPDRCYLSPAAAQNDGYRASKR